MWQIFTKSQIYDPSEQGEYHVRSNADVHLAAEHASETKHEYFDGRIYAMAGATRAHNLIVANTVATLHQQVRRRPCEVYPSDMKVQSPQSTLYTYPDVVFVCGDPLFSDVQKDILLNPTVIIEVLSDSTENYDRTLKMLFYRYIKSLREYMLISQTRRLVVLYTWQETDRWEFRFISGHDAVIELPSISCALALTNVYEKVQFIPDTDDSMP